jgi:NTP pyrophosphatase (non-canonical NTP hydrolase)
MEKYYQAIVDFHKKFKMKGTNNEEMTFRLNLLTEELGELAKAVTKGKPKKEVIEENIDLLYLVLGNFVSLGIKPRQIEKTFFDKHNRNMTHRKKRLKNGKYRVSAFKS